MTTTIDTDASAAGPFTPTGVSRREAYRARIESPAAVYVLRPSTATPGWRRCHLRDVSACGAGVDAVSLDLQDGDAVLLRFGTEADGFQVRGRIVRMAVGSARTAYGIRFGGLDPRQVDSLHKFVMRNATGRHSARPSGSRVEVTDGPCW